jgi:hypothetical protein
MTVLHKWWAPAKRQFPLLIRQTSAGASIDGFPLDGDHMNDNKLFYRNILGNWRLRVPSLLLQLAAGLLAAGTLLLRAGFIGPVGMRRIWKCAEFFEQWADRLRHRLS